jgi:hypothetical protein
MNEDQIETNVSDSTANAPENKPASFENLSKEELLERLARLESKSSRLEDESRKYKRNWQETKAKIEEREKAALEEQGKFRELYEAERKKNEDIFRSYVKTKVQSAVSQHAQKAGCVSVDALLKLGNPEYLQYDENNESVVGVETFIEDARKNNPFLFTQKVNANINAASPSGGYEAPRKFTAKDYTKLNSDQQKNILAELFGRKK